MYPRVTALDMLDHLAVLKGFANGRERRETVDALLHQVNLWDVRKKALAGSQAACGNGSASRRRSLASRS